MKRSRILLVAILVAVAALVTSLWVGEGPLVAAVIIAVIALCASLWVREGGCGES